MNKAKMSLFFCFNPYFALSIFIQVAKNSRFPALLLLRFVTTDIGDLNKIKASFWGLILELTSSVDRKNF